MSKPILFAILFPVLVHSVIGCCSKPAPEEVKPHARVERPHHPFRGAQDHSATDTTATKPMPVMSDDVHIYGAPTKHVKGAKEAKPQPGKPHKRVARSNAKPGEPTFRVVNEDELGKELATFNTRTKKLRMTPGTTCDQVVNTLVTEILRKGQKE